MISLGGVVNHIYIYHKICKVIEQNDKIWVGKLKVILISLLFTCLYFFNVLMTIVHYSFNLKSYLKSFSNLAPYRFTGQPSYMFTS